MGISRMKHNFPGLIIEPMPSGKSRYRVRVSGSPKRRIRIHCSPDHPMFQEQYLAARAGFQPEEIQELNETNHRLSLGWLIIKYLSYFETEVTNGRKSAKTLKKKRNLFEKLRPYWEYESVIPRKNLMELQDRFTAKPAQADALIEAIRVMYSWAMDREIVAENPAIGIKKIYQKGPGTTPWQADDVKQFLEFHPLGTKPHAALQVLMWTNCRVEDLTVLGRGHERLIDGIEAIRFQPSKKGSSLVTIPLMPGMKLATRALKVQGRTYILGRGGKPYSSGDSMSAMFIRWCKDAGLKNRSAHGIRKGFGELMAELGCSQYEIMAIHGHSEARTSETYTRGAERWKLAKSAMEKLNVSHGFK